jgi:hypothetical protein
MKAMIAACSAILALTAWTAMATAQPCNEGRTFTGECVNPTLAASMRLSAIIFSQPKLSYTAYPVLPSDDQLYRYPSQLNPSPGKPAPIGVAVPPPPPSP